MIRTSNQAHELLLRIPESTLCNLARHYKENTVCADVIEFTENRRHPLRALSASHSFKCELLQDCSGSAYKTLL